MKITWKMKFWLIYYKLLKWRTHDVFFEEYPKGYLYIGARKYGQSPKNLFHLNLKSFE